MGWRYVAPGIFLVLVKITGTSLFLAFIPEIFPRGNFSFVPEENFTAVQVPELRWESYRGNLYTFSEEMLEWGASYSECMDQNSNLVIINDKKEMEFLQNKTRNADYFIGLEYPDDDNKWLWLDGTEPKGNLFTMRPNEVNKQCATLRGSVVSPASCFQKNRWICEKRNG
uniref:C-type lectin domain family 5 member A-like n=1 Tax=Euleptes europaea TaxID=460621 RepID=UPI0025408BB1|nr:C-type lectin domain family 5 member A-like [Euleptes europaea]